MWRRLFGFSLFAMICLGIASGVGAPLSEQHRDQVLKTLDKIAQEQQDLTLQVNQLRRLLGRRTHLDDLNPLPPDSELSESIRLRLGQGNKAYLVRQYKEAKEAYHKAWEEDPTIAATNYNLGLAYFQMGNGQLARKMLMSALELDKEIQGADEVRAYLEDDDEMAVEVKPPDLLKPIKTELINLNKEAESYANSRVLTRSERTRHTVKTLRAMEELASPHKELKRNYYREIAQLYAHLDLYSQALKVYREFENAMEGEILPDGYHSEVLQVEEKQKALTQVLQHYRHNTSEPRIRKTLLKDLKELEIFAVQIDEFVEALEPADPDFEKISKRLAEFRWGKQPGRHVLVYNRFEDLVYSSLAGTLSLDRYQDNKGRQFLRHITMLADELQLKEADFFEVELSVNGRIIPYVVMYTYIPRHEAFIVVRLPKEELTEA